MGLFFPGWHCGRREVIPTKLFHLLSKTRRVWEHRKHTQSMETQKHVQSTFNHTQCTRTKKHRHCTGTQKHIQSTFNIETHTKYIWTQKHNHRNTKTNTQYANTETQQSVVTQKHTKITCEHRSSQNQDTSLTNIKNKIPKSKSPKFLYYPSIMKFLQQNLQWL